MILLLVSIVRAEFLTGGEGNLFDPNQCGISWSCMANIPMCQPGSENCAFAAWKPNGKNLDISLTLKGSPELGWVAFGIAPAGTMEKADIYYCEDRTSGVGVESAWAPQNTGPSRDASYDAAIIKDSITTTKVNGTFACSFTKLGSFTKENIDYNLTDANAWHILLAKGPLNGDNPDYHGYSKDGHNAVATEEAIKIFPGMEPITINAEKGTEEISLVKVHAIMMFLAWGVLAPIGISASAVMKVTLSGKIGKQWFNIHRAILSMVLLLTVTAFILIFVEKKAWVTFDKSIPHAVMGCIVTAFCLINPIMGLLRPGLESPNRWIFNIAHYIVGYGAQCLAFATILIGTIDLFGLEDWTEDVFITAIVLWIVAVVGSKVRLVLGRNQVTDDGMKNEESFLGTLFTVLLLIALFVYLALSISVLIELSQ